jgi:heme exporter protein A
MLPLQDGPNMMSSDAPLIIIDQVSKIYDLRPVLKQITVTMPRGQFVTLLGPNGSGKSTLLRLLCGLTPPTHGTISIGGWQIPREIQEVRAHIGLVSHKTLLYESLTGRENLHFFAGLYPIPQSERTDRIAVLLKQVGLHKRADQLVRTYSRGMMQRLSIARALLHSPDVLLFDEPYTGLDPEASATLDTLLQDAHSKGHTLVMTTHELDRAARLAQRALILHRGQLVLDEPTSPDLATRFATVTGTLPTP